MSSMSSLHFNMMNVTLVTGTTDQDTPAHGSPRNKASDGHAVPAVSLFQQQTLRPQMEKAASGQGSQGTFWSQIHLENVPEI